MCSGAMTNTTSYLSRDGGEALDFVSDQTQAAEGALAQLTEPSRTTNFVGCSEGPTARQDAQLVAAQVRPGFKISASGNTLVRREQSIASQRSRYDTIIGAWISAGC